MSTSFDATQCTTNCVRKSGSRSCRREPLAGLQSVSLLHSVNAARKDSHKESRVRSIRRESGLADTYTTHSFHANKSS